MCCACVVVFWSPDASDRITKQKMRLNAKQTLKFNQRFVPAWRHLILLCWCEKSKLKENKPNVRNCFSSEPVKNQTQIALMRRPAVSHNRSHTDVRQTSLLSPGFGLDWVRFVTFTGSVYESRALLPHVYCLISLASLLWDRQAELEQMCFFTHTDTHKIWAEIHFLWLWPPIVALCCCAFDQGQRQTPRSYESVTMKQIRLIILSQNVTTLSALYIKLEIGFIRIHTAH